MGSNTSSLTYEPQLDRKYPVNVPKYADRLRMLYKVKYRWREASEQDRKAGAAVELWTQQRQPGTGQIGQWAGIAYKATAEQDQAPVTSSASSTSSSASSKEEQPASEEKETATTAPLNVVTPPPAPVASDEKITTISRTATSTSTVTTKGSNATANADQAGPELQLNWTLNLPSNIGRQTILRQPFTYRRRYPAGGICWDGTQGRDGVLEVRRIDPRFQLEGAWSDDDAAKTHVWTSRKATATKTEQETEGSGEIESTKVARLSDAFDWTIWGWKTGNAHKAIKYDFEDAPTDLSVIYALPKAKGDSFIIPEALMLCSDSYHASLYITPQREIICAHNAAHASHVSLTPCLSLLSSRVTLPNRCTVELQKQPADSAFVVLSAPHKHGVASLHILPLYHGDAAETTVVVSQATIRSAFKGAAKAAYEGEEHEEPHHHHLHHHKPIALYVPGTNDFTIIPSNATTDEQDEEVEGDMIKFKVGPTGGDILIAPVHHDARAGDLNLAMFTPMHETVFIPDPPPPPPTPLPEPEPEPVQEQSLPGGVADLPNVTIEEEENTTVDTPSQPTTAKQEQNGEPSGPPTLLGLLHSVANWLVVYIAVSTGLEHLLVYLPGGPTIPPPSNSEAKKSADTDPAHQAQAQAAEDAVKEAEERLEHEMSLSDTSSLTATELDLEHGSVLGSPKLKAFVLDQEQQEGPIAAAAPMPLDAAAEAIVNAEPEQPKGRTGYVFDRSYAGSTALFIVKGAKSTLVEVDGVEIATAQIESVKGDDGAASFLLRVPLDHTLEEQEPLQLATITFKPKPEELASEGELVQA